MLAEYTAPVSVGLPIVALDYELELRFGRNSKKGDKNGTYCRGKYSR